MLSENNYLSSCVLPFKINFSFFKKKFEMLSYRLMFYSWLLYAAHFTQGPVSQADDREAKRDTPEEGELREQRMEITIRNSPYTREDSTEDRFV